MKRSIFVLGVILVLSGCRENDSSSAALIESRISNRPIVALVPVIDHSHSDLNWSLSEEFSLALRHRLTQKNNLYLAREENFANSQKYLAWCDPFELDTSWIKKAFSQQEFVVFTELMKHTEIPVISSTEPLVDIKEAPAELLLAIRVNVFDLRGKTPKIVLQEIIEQSHHIPREFTKTHATPVAWDHEGFDISLLGIAHDTLSKEVASRIEDYILTSGL